MTTRQEGREMERLAAGLSYIDRHCVIALCGNAWSGFGVVTPGLRAMQKLGLMRIVRLGDRYKAHPTEEATALRNHLLGAPDDE